MPINWLVGMSGIGLLTWVPEILTVIAFVSLIVTAKMRGSLPRPQLLIVAILVLQLVLQVGSGAGPGGTAVLSVAFVTMLFYRFLIAGDAADSTTLRTQVQVIYGLHIAFILFEVLLLSSGRAGVLVALSGGAYKAAGIYNDYGLSPQSLSLQSQAASQFCVFAAAWFGMLYVARRPLNIRFTPVHASILAAALAIFVSYPNTTMQIVGVLLFGFVVFFTPFAPSRLTRLLILGTVVLTFSTLYANIAYKVGIGYQFATQADPWRVLTYQRIFYNPIEVFAGLPLAVRLFGLGGAASLTTAGLTDADFGFAIVILQVGVVVGLIALVAALRPAIRVIRAGYGPLIRNQECFPWLWLGYANALLVIGNILSTFHYNVALQSGGRTLFSFHIALTLFAWKQLKRCQATTSAAAA